MARKTIARADTPPPFTKLSMAAAASGLFESCDLQLWRASYNCYHSIIEEISAQKEKKSSKPKKHTLLELDTWYQDELPDVVSSREEPHLKHEELCKLMAWKLTRGKFRPRLTELIRENSPESVERVTRKGFSLLPNLKGAVETLCQLRGVGPATASALLCAAAPDNAPFMADEAVMAVPGLGKLDYTLKHYLSYTEAVGDKAKELNTICATVSPNGPDKTHWTAHDVELALWAHHLAQKLKPEILDLTISSCRKRISSCEHLSVNKKSKPNS
ncbi:uncharacterized protein LOC135351919 isoform X2 [Halichondria panicea]|uniref:uncharacterized protein LOC135351919 isoform X2 n=1 Tax=Halichondria panicea TaxID=6063 RepID=UPI00312B5B45